MKEMVKTQQPSGNTLIFWKTEYRARKVIIIPTELREKKVKVRTSCGGRCSSDHWNVLDGGLRDGVRHEKKKEVRI